ncbi:MAG: phage holin family protein [Myxococcales bacterium]|nr:phage holin family protein [Myxococcales bacterium]
MLEFVTHVVLSAFLIAVVGRLVSGVEVEDAFAAVVAAVVLGIANAVVRPLLVVLTFPLTVLTLGLFLLVVNALVLWLVSAVVPGFRVRGFGSAFVGALVLSLLNVAIAVVFGV